VEQILQLPDEPLEGVRFSGNAGIEPLPDGPNAWRGYSHVGSPPVARRSRNPRQSSLWAARALKRRIQTTRSPAERVVVSRMKRSREIRGTADAIVMDLAGRTPEPLLSRFQRGSDQQAD
jgi:hypothetical protein